MITIEQLRNLKNNDGMTLKDGLPIEYKTGWQVATEGIETRDAQEALAAIENYHGDCGIWLSDGIFYIDKSHRVKTKQEALEIGRAHNQISIFGWARKNLAYCAE